MKKLSSSFSAVAVFAGLVVAGWISGGGAAGASEVVEERVAHMRAVADDMRVVADMLFGIAPFDAARVEALMGQVQARSGAAMLAHFPAGSLSPESRARANIWQADGGLDKDFAKRAQALEVLAGKLREYARAEGKSGFVARVQAIVAKSAYLNVDRKLLAKARAAMQPLRDTFLAMADHCKGCHESFRKKKAEKSGEAGADAP